MKNMDANSRKYYSKHLKWWNTTHKNQMNGDDDAISGAASSTSDSTASSAKSATAGHPFLDRKHQSDQSAGRKCSSTRWLLINTQLPSSGRFFQAVQLRQHRLQFLNNPHPRLPSLQLHFRTPSSQTFCRRNCWLRCCLCRYSNCVCVWWEYFDNE